MKKPFLLLFTAFISLSAIGQGTYEFTQFMDNYEPLTNTFFREYEINPEGGYGLNLSGDTMEMFGKRFALGIPTPLGIGGNGSLIGYRMADSLAFYIFGFHGMLTNIDSNSYLTGRLDGLPGQGIMKFEFHQVGFEQADSSSRISFQIWMDLSAKAVEIRIGPGNLETYTDPVEIGLVLNKLTPQGPEVKDAYMLKGSAANPEISRTDSFIALDDYPVPGTVYRFDWDTMTTGISGQPPSASLNVFPNPAKDLVKVKTGQCAIQSVSIYNMAGNLLQQGSLGKQGMLDVGSLTAGMYLIRVRTEAGLLSRRLVIRR